MNKILVIGAGRSASALIEYLLKQAKSYSWTVTVADTNLGLAKEKVKGHPNAKTAELNIRDKAVRETLIIESDVVISMLPAFLHTIVAKDCLSYGRHLITASYVSPEMRELAEKARKKGLVFMGEMGLDPGIDHMSAMKKIHEIKEKGGDLSVFYSYTGGLIAPESDTNPWHYKFTWNPRNVILAGQGTAQYLENGKYKYTPYDRLFSDIKTIDIPNFGPLEMYANRDSLSYRTIYNLEDIPTIIRGTLRYPGYCQAWNAFVQIGLTDDSYKVQDLHNLTYRDWVDAYLKSDLGDTVEERVCRFLDLEMEGEVMRKLKWSGIFDLVKIPLKEASPAQILEDLLVDKWKLDKSDKDLIVMQHEFHYALDGQQFKDTSTMILKGHDSIDTAMSRTVGLPVGILAKQILLGNVVKADMQIPVEKHIYGPVLDELEEYEIRFEEHSEAL